jgi:hypothetical protein
MWKGVNTLNLHDFRDYSIAELPSEEVETICDLEKALCTKTNNDIILIAYQQKDRAEN